MMLAAVKISFWSGLCVITICLQTVSAIDCTTSLDYVPRCPLSRRLIVDCNQNPVRLTWETDAFFGISDLRIDVSCPSIDYNEDIADISYGFNVEPINRGVILISSEAVGQECTYSGCVRDTCDEYRFSSVTCPGRIQITSSSVATVPPSSSPQPEQLSTVTVSTLVPDTRIESTPTSTIVAMTADVLPSVTSFLAVSPVNPNVEDGLLVKVVPLVLVILTLLALSLPTGLCCILYRRSRRSTMTSNRLCIGEQVEMLYKLEEDHMDESFITSIGRVPLHSPSMTSLCTLLDPFKPSLLAESNDSTSPFGRYKIALDQVLERSTPTSSQESVDCHVKSNLEREDSSGHESLPSLSGPPDFKLQPTFEGQGQETVWSELEMCFSDSDNENAMEEDRDSKEYFKVEDLGPYTNVGSARKMEGDGYRVELREEGGDSIVEGMELVAENVEDLSETVLKQTDMHRTVQECMEVDNTNDSEGSRVVEESSRKPSFSLNSIADDSGFDSSLPCHLTDSVPA